MFNTLPRVAIEGDTCAIQRVSLPEDGGGVIPAEQGFKYPGRYGMRQRMMDRGILQESVLSPLVWNPGYNTILQVSLPDGVTLVCYADDTFV